MKAQKELDGAIMYHFCAEQHVKKILKEGLTKGGVVEFGPKNTMKLHTGWIWLTSNGLRQFQKWEGKILIPYSRTAWRLTIHIPYVEMHRLYDREKLLKIYPGAEELFRVEGSRSWKVFRGQIPKEWILEAEAMNQCR